MSPKGVYVHARRHPLDRMADKFVVGDGCWEWTANLTPAGYAQLADWPNRPFAVHRYLYETMVGPIPDGLELDHLCRNTKCIRPDHLEPVTHQENMLRGFGFTGINARKMHCPQGHPYDEVNTYLRRAKKGDLTWQRRCRICVKASRAKHKEKVRATRTA